MGGLVDRCPTPVSICLSLCCVYSALVHAESLTGVGKLPDDDETYLVSISEESLSELRKVAGRAVLVTLERIGFSFATAADEDGKANVDTMGFHWKEGHTSDCDLYEVRPDGTLGDRQSARIEQPCEENADSLAWDVVRYDTRLATDSTGEGLWTYNTSLNLMKSILAHDSHQATPAYDWNLALENGALVVQSGDTLSAISRKLTGEASRWEELYAFNSIYANEPLSADDLNVGAMLKLPPEMLAVYLTASHPVLPFSEIEADWELQDIATQVGFSDIESEWAIRLLNHEIVAESPPSGWQPERVWIPAALDGWTTKSVVETSPQETSWQLYGTGHYNVLIRTLCKRALVLGEPCTVPDLRFAESSWLNRLGETVLKPTDYRTVPGIRE